MNTHTKRLQVDASRKASHDDLIMTRARVALICCLLLLLRCLLLLARLTRAARQTARLAKPLTRCVRASRRQSLGAHLMMSLCGKFSQTVGANHKLQISSRARAAHNRVTQTRATAKLAAFRSSLAAAAAATADIARRGVAQ